MRGLPCLLTLATCSLVFLTNATSSMTSSGESVAETYRCFKTLQESGKRIYVTYDGTTMRLFDVNGDEVSCDVATQQRIRQKSDRRCLFSPIHCLFNKRIQTARMLKMRNNGGIGNGEGAGGGRIFVVRRRK